MPQNQSNRILYFLLMLIAAVSWVLYYRPYFFTGYELLFSMARLAVIIAFLALVDRYAPWRLLRYTARGLALIIVVYIHFDALVLTITSINFIESMVIFAQGGDFVLTMVEAGFPPVLIYLLPVIIFLVLALGSGIAFLLPEIKTGMIFDKALLSFTAILMAGVIGDQFVNRDTSWYQTRRHFPANFSFFSDNSRTISVPLKANLPAPLPDSTGVRNPKNVIVILLESFRHDVVTPDVAPRLSRLMERSTRFTGAFGNGIYTSLSWNALLMNRPAWMVDRDARGVSDSEPGSPIFRVFKEAGYKTGIFTSANMEWNGFYRRITGKEKIVNRYYSSYADHRDLPRNRLDTLTVEGVEKFITGDSGGKPYFLLVQLDSTHWTYFPDEDLCDNKPYVHEINMFGLTNAEAIKPVYNRYLNSVRTVDNRIGRLLTFLEKNGTMKDTVVCVVSDHGEGFAPGRVGHSVLHDDIRRIFLGIHFPGGEGRVEPAAIQHDSVFPLIFSYLGVTEKGKNAPTALSEKKGGGFPLVVFHGSIRMADLVYKDKSIRFMTRVTKDGLKATPVFEYDGKNLHNITMIDTLSVEVADDFRSAIR